MKAKPSPGSETAQIQELQLLDIWKFLIRRRVYILAGLLLGLVLGIVAYVIAPRLYTSTVTVEMNRDATSGLGLQDLSGSASALGIGDEFMTDMLTQEAVLMSDSTALVVIDRLNLLSTQPYLGILNPKKGPAMPPTMATLEHSALVRDQILSVFRSKLRVAPVKNTRLLTVSYTDPNPARAAQVANTVVEAYLTNHTRTRYEATLKASTWLNDQLADLKHQAEDIHRQVSDMERDSGIISVATPSAGLSASGNAFGGAASSGSSEPVVANPEYTQLVVLSQEYSQAQLVTIQQGAIYRLTETSDPNALFDENGARLALSDGTALGSASQGMVLMQSLRSQEAQLQSRMAGLRVTYGPRNPAILEIQNQIDAIHKQMVGELGSIRNQAKKSYELAQANEDAIRKQLALQQEKVSSLGNRIAALAFLREQEATSRRLYQDLYTRLEEANIAAGVRSSGMAVVDPALPPSRVASPVLRMNLAVGIAGGFLFGTLLAVYRQLRDTALNIPDEFDEMSPHPMLGIVPGFESGSVAAYGEKTATKKVTDEAWIVRSPKSQLAEAYRQIRTSILLSSIDNPPKVLLFTSPVSGDGKSTTVYNLAAAFAAQSAKILILDADMRRSTIGKLGGFTERRGLSDILSTGLPFDEVVQVSPNLPTMHVLLSGAVPPDPAELLGSKRFASLISDLRAQYDFIFIDAPPALLVTDPIVVSTVADTVIAVVRAGKTQKAALRRLWAVLDTPATRVLGFIVNDFNRRLQSYGYGYEGYDSYRGYSRYGYGYGYGAKENIDAKDANDAS